MALPENKLLRTEKLETVITKLKKLSVFLSTMHIMTPIFFCHFYLLMTLFHFFSISIFSVMLPLVNSHPLTELLFIILFIYSFILPNPELATFPFSYVCTGNGSYL